MSWEGLQAFPPKPCDYCEDLTNAEDLLVRPMYVEGALEYWDVCRACYSRLRGVIHFPPMADEPQPAPI